MSATVYATAADIRASGYPLSAAQETAASTLLEQASAMLRTKARGVGKDLDALIADGTTGEDYLLVVRAVVVKAAERALESTSSGASAIVQGSQTIGSYSVQQTYFNPGQSLYFTKNELRDLGLHRSQRCGAVDPWATGEDDA